MKKALLLLGVLTVAGAAQGGTQGLPPAVFTATGSLEGLAASGPSVALAVDEPGNGCVVRLGPPGALRPLDGQLPCRASAQDGDSLLTDLWLARGSVAAKLVYSASPHSEDWSFWLGSRPNGPLSQQGETWTWNDSDAPPGNGCAWAVVAGGGVIASTRVPNHLAVDRGLASKPACPAGATTTIRVTAKGRTVLQGSWTPLATDGRHLVVGRLDALGRRTGEAELVELSGRKLPFEQPDPPIIRGATAAWLAPEGLVVRTGPRIWGGGWTADRVRAATVGQGRVVYAVGGTLRVHRIGSGPDRVLLHLPKGAVALAAGSFGVAVTVAPASRISLHSLPWSTIDRTLTR